MEPVGKQPIVGQQVRVGEVHQRSLVTHKRLGGEQCEHIEVKSAQKQCLALAVGALAREAHRKELADAAIVHPLLQLDVRPWQRGVVLEEACIRARLDRRLRPSLDGLPPLACFDRLSPLAGSGVAGL